MSRAAKRAPSVGLGLPWTEADVEIDAIVSRVTNRAARKVPELAASIEREGLLNRVLLRHLGDHFELLGGERRMRAHQLLGRTTIPAKVVECDDAKAAELAEIDNLQREDLTPIEEGEAYKRLLESESKLDVRELAHRVGRTETHVRQRLQLTELDDDVRGLVDSGALDIGAALLVAQTPASVQAKVGPQLLSASERGRISRDVVQSIVQQYSMPLAEAPFDTSSTTLVPQVGACGSCSKRTGTQGVLLEVLDEEDTCLDRACWLLKVKAHRELVTEEAGKKGLKVLTDEESRKNLSAGRSVHSSKWKAVSEHVYAGNDAIEVRTLVGDDVPRTIGFDEEGRAVELVPAAVVNEALAARAATVEKVKAKAKGAEPSAEELEAAHQKETEKRQAKVATLREARRLALEHVRDQVVKGAVPIDVSLRALIGNADGESYLVVVDALDLEIEKGKKRGDIIAARNAVIDLAASVSYGKESEQVKTRQLVALAAQLDSVRVIQVGPNSDDARPTPPFLEAFGLDWAATCKAAGRKAAAKAKGKKSKDVPF